MNMAASRVWGENACLSLTAADGLMYVQLRRHQSQRMSRLMNLKASLGETLEKTRGADKAVDLSSSWECRKIGINEPELTKAH